MTDNEGNLIFLRLSSLISHLQALYDEHGDMRVWAEALYWTYDDHQMASGPLTDLPEVEIVHKSGWMEKPEKILIISTDQG